MEEHRPSLSCCLVAVAGLSVILQSLGSTAVGARGCREIDRASNPIMPVRQTRNKRELSFFGPSCPPTFLRSSISSHALCGPLQLSSTCSMVFFLAVDGTVPIPCTAVTLAGTECYAPLWLCAALRFLCISCAFSCIHCGAISTVHTTSYLAPTQTYTCVSDNVVKRPGYLQLMCMYTAKHSICLDACYDVFVLLPVNRSN